MSGQSDPSDPTRAGFPPPAGSARLSLGEVEALCLKAARGAGLDWGLAEEAGFAARWLAARGLDGPRALLTLLDRGMAEGWQTLRPALDGGTLAAPGGTLCPLAFGAYLSDLGALPARLPEAEVARPLLILPFLTPLDAQGVTLRWADGAASVAPDGTPGGDLGGLAALDSARIAFAPGARPSPPPAPTYPTPATLAALDSHALRTTVPATALSRADAGAAGGDND